MRQLPMYLRICCAFVAYTLAGCAGVPASIPLHDGSYAMTATTTVAIGGGASVRYDAFTDSRCPPTAKCIWAGKVSYHFTLRSPAGTEAFALDYAGQHYQASSMPGLRFAIGFAGLARLPLERHAVMLEVLAARPE